MIEYNKAWTFTNELGTWGIAATTAEHPNNYGNGTMLRLEHTLVPDKIYNAPPSSYDLRYENISNESDLDNLVTNLIEKEYGKVCYIGTDKQEG